MQTKKFSLHDFAGGTVLSREEMKNVKGGMAPSGGNICNITTSGPGYSNPQHSLIPFDSSQAAEDYCNELISTSGNGVYHCKYACGY